MMTKSSIPSCFFDDIKAEQRLRNIQALMVITGARERRTEILEYFDKIIQYQDELEGNKND